MRVIVEALDRGLASGPEVLAATWLTRRRLQYALTWLHEAGGVEMHGSAGDRTSRYALRG